MNVHVCVCVCISYNMGKKDLPDIFALARGPRRPEGVGIYIKQIPIAHVIGNAHKYMTGFKKIDHLCATTVIHFYTHALAALPRNTK